jgi:hypothetical protein
MIEGAAENAAVVQARPGVSSAKRTAVHLTQVASTHRMDETVYVVEAGRETP